MDSVKAPVKKPRKRKSDKALIADSPQQFLLKDVVITKLVAERFSAPARGSKGVFSLTPDCRDLNVEDVPENGVETKGNFIYSMKLDGFVGVESGPIPKDAQKSFSIQLELLAVFTAVGVYVPNTESLNQLASEIIGQVHAIGASRLSEIASDLGFYGVRPALWVKRKTFSFEPEAE